MFSMGLIILNGCSPSIRFSSSKSQPHFSKQETKESQKINKPKKNNSTSERSTLRPDYKTESSLIQLILDEADSFIGTPYIYGGTTRMGFDCSGYVMTVYSAVGILLPRTAKEQYEFTSRISKNEIKPSDLVFFSEKSVVSHVGIYVGNDTFIHASSSNGVVYESLSKQGYLNLVGFGRHINLYSQN